MFWNVNGRSPATLQDIGSLQQLQQYDIVCLTETLQSAAGAFDLYFPLHDSFERLATQRVKGMGVTTLVHKRLRPFVKPAASPNQLLQLVTISLQPPATPVPLAVLNCYIPPAGSPQLTQLSHLDTFQHLTQLISSLCDPDTTSSVLLGGDLNAHVRFDAELPVGFNAAGGMLVELAGNCDLDFCLVHNNAQPASFETQAGDRVARSSPDHVLTSCLLPATATSAVRTDIVGSDHRPVTACIKWQSPASNPCAHLGPHYANGRLRWQGREADYCIEIRRAIESGAFAEAEQQLLQDTSAAPLLPDLIMYAGIRSNHYTAPRNPSPQPPKPVVHQPWFDAECKQLREHHRSCLRRYPHGHSEVRAAARTYHSTCRRKQRAWARQAVDSLAEQASHDAVAFWRRFSSAKRPPPAAVSAADIDSCTAVLKSVLACPDDPVNSVAPGNLSDAADHALNQPFTQAEVEAVLRNLHNGLSCGPDGIPAEFLKYAVMRDDRGQVQEYMLAPYLLTLFNHLFNQGTLPTQWTASLLTLLHKKGDKSNWNNYRPLAVSHVFAKLYALLLSRRLTRWAEENHILCPAQVGFRPKHSTTMNNFVLLHLVDKCRSMGLPLYVCFIDFSKAYDRVVRQHVWQRLYDWGCRGKILYAGLRQGCPLSPFLFNVIMQRLWQLLQDYCPNSGLELPLPATSAADVAAGAPPEAQAPSPALQAGGSGPGGITAGGALGVTANVTSLGYADDVANTACLPHRAQQQLNAVNYFMFLERMVAGFDKSQVMVFNASCQTDADRKFVFKLDQRQLQRVRFADQAAAYHPWYAAACSKTWAACSCHLTQKGQGAGGASQCKCYVITIPVHRYAKPHIWLRGLGALVSAC